TTVTEITCNPTNNGIIDVHASGGWGGYEYYVGLTSAPAPVDSDYVTGTRFENLVAGDYTIWIKDQSGCIITRTETLVNPDPITATLQINDDNCAAFEGEIEVVDTAGGQGSNYSYQLIKDGTNVGSPQNTAVFSGLGAGSYEVQIQDQWGCDL